MIRRLVAILFGWSLCLALSAQKSSVIVLLDSTSVCVKSLESYSYFHHEKFLVMDNKGADFANVVISMDDNTDLEKFEYVMSDLLGNVIRTVKSRELQKVEYSSELATNNYRLVAEVIPPCFPVMITRIIRMSHKKNVLSYPPFYPQSAYDMEVTNAVYQIEWPEDKVTMRHKEMNYVGECSERTAGKMKSLRFALNNLKPVVRVPYSPQLEERVPFVLFAPSEISYYDTKGNMRDWSSLGQWNVSLCDDNGLLPASLMDKVNTLVANCQTDCEKVAVLKSMLDRDTRYVSIQLGIGGYQPESASRVREMGYGDCKGLSNYMSALLKIVGIESHLAAISTEDQHLIPDFANFNQLNHMILAVILEHGKDTVWLECTNPQLPAGYIHDNISGHDALWLSSDQCAVVRVPEYADSLNLRHSDIKIDLYSDASAEIAIDESFYNHRYPENLYLLKEKDQEIRTKISSWYKLVRTDLGAITIKDQCKPFSVPQIDTHLDGHCTKYASLTGKRLFVPLNPLHKNFSPISIQDTVSSVQLPMVIRYGYRNEENIVIEIPEGFSVESLPAPIDIKEEFGSFLQVVKQENGKLRIFVSLNMLHGNYSSESRQRLLEMQRLMQKAYNARVVLLRK